MQLTQTSMRDFDVPTRIFDVMYPTKVGDVAGFKMDVRLVGETVLVSQYVTVKDASDLKLYQRHLPKVPEKSDRLRRVTLAFSAHFDPEGVNGATSQTDLIQVKMHDPDVDNGLYVSV